MADLKWTRKMPTVEGLYIAREKSHQGTEHFAVRLRVLTEEDGPQFWNGGELYEVGSLAPWCGTMPLEPSCDVDIDDAEWLGPLPEEAE